MRTWEKDPSATLDWKFNWTNWLSAAEEISSATVTVSAGLTKVSDTNTANTVTVWLSGGTLGESYTVNCRITTNQGRTDERTIGIRLTDR
jgi:broad specificity phosphatase PhoE